MGAGESPWLMSPRHALGFALPRSPSFGLLAQNFMGCLKCHWAARLGSQQYRMGLDVPPCDHASQRKVWTLPRSTLCQIEGSNLSQMFSDAFIHNIPKDTEAGFLQMRGCIDERVQHISDRLLPWLIALQAWCTIVCMLTASRGWGIMYACDIHPHQSKRQRLCRHSCEYCH